MGVSDRQEAWTVKTNRQKYAKDQDYMVFRQKIFVRTYLPGALNYILNYIY